MNFCSNRIFALTTGPRCEGNPEVFDQAQCTKGRWVDYVVPPDGDVKENAQWYNYLSHIQEVYLKSLARMLDILKQLRDFDEDVDDERLKILGLEVESLINNMEKTCYQVYKLMLTTPTFTKEEMRAKHEDTAVTERVHSQESSARLAALRASRGLAPVPEK